MAVYCPEKCGPALYPECIECKDKICEYFACLVAGGRTFNDYRLMERSLNYLLQYHIGHVIIVSGGAKGADSLVERYAKEHNILLKVFPAQWDLYGKSAGYRRNCQMHEYIAKFTNRGCVAFWDGMSKGTAHNFSLSEKYGTPLKVIHY